MHALDDWREVELIFEHEAPSPQNDEILIGLLVRLASNPEGLRLLLEKVRPGGRFPQGHPLYYLLSKALGRAWEEIPEEGIKNAGRLAAVLTRGAAPHEETYWRSLYVLHRVQSPALGPELRRFLLDLRPAVDLSAAFREAVAGLIPPRHWVPMLETARDPDLPAAYQIRLDEAIERLRQPASPSVQTPPERRGLRAPRRSTGPAGVAPAQPLSPPSRPPRTFRIESASTGAASRLKGEPMPAKDPGISPPMQPSPRPASRGGAPVAPGEPAEIPRAMTVASPPSMPIPGPGSEDLPTHELKDRPILAATPADPVSPDPGATTEPSAPVPAAETTASATAPDRAPAVHPPAKPADGQAASASPAVTGPNPPPEGSDRPAAPEGPMTEAKSPTTEHATKIPAPPIEGVGPLEDVPPRLEELETYLACVMRTILGMLRGREDERSLLLESSARIQKDNEQLRAEVAAAWAQIEVLTGELEEARRALERARADADPKADQVRPM